MKQAKKKEVGTAKGIIGFALAGAVAAAGAYFLYGTKEGTKSKQKIKGWALRAKGEVLEKLENLKEMNEEKYNEVVSSVMKKYEKMKKDHAPEVNKLHKELASHWKYIKGEFGKKK